MNSSKPYEVDPWETQEGQWQEPEWEEIPSEILTAQDAEEIPTEQVYDHEKILEESFEEKKASNKITEKDLLRWGEKPQHLAPHLPWPPGKFYYIRSQQKENRHGLKGYAYHAAHPDRPYWLREQIILEASGDLSTLELPSVGIISSENARARRASINIARELASHGAGVVILHGAPAWEEQAQAALQEGFISACSGKSLQQLDPGGILEMISKRGCVITNRQSGAKLIRDAAQVIITCGDVSLLKEDFRAALSGEKGPGWLSSAEQYKEIIELARVRQNQPPQGENRKKAEKKIKIKT